jgi:hypothetical protein
MNKAFKLAGLTAFSIALATGAYFVTARAQERHMGHFAHGMGPGVMGMMGPRMMAHDERTQAELQVIHAMFINHDRIKRTVENLPNGIRTVTESDDPALAGMIKQHVAEMGKRVDAGDDPGLPIESDALRAIFRDKAKIKTSYDTTDKGIVVVQTSDDPKTVAALQKHASEVSDFVQEGMAALHAAMMKNRAGVMGGGMMRGMMHRSPI